MAQARKSFYLEDKFLDYLEKSKNLPTEEINKYKNILRFLSENHPDDIKGPINRKKINDIINDEDIQKDNRREYSSSADIEMFKISLEAYSEFYKAGACFDTNFEEVPKISL